MRTEAEFYLRFPALFRGKPEFEIRDGWFDLLWDLCEKIDSLMIERGIDHRSPEYPEITLLKEKLGFLRVHINAGFDESGQAVRELVNTVENRSGSVCQSCGEPGESGTMGTYRMVLCARCAEEYALEFGATRYAITWITDRERGEPMKTDDEFYTRFPALFRQRPDLEIPDGWRKMLWRLCERIDGVLRVAGIDSTSYPIVVQVKEKMGALRFYVDMEDLDDSVAAELGKMVEQAEPDSIAVCVICGQPAEYGVLDGRITSLCPVCIEKQIETERNEGFGGTWDPIDND